MQTIRNYTDTKHEYDIAKARLDWLMLKKERIFSECFPLSAKVNETGGGKGTSTSDPMGVYIDKLTTVDVFTGKSLYEDIEEQCTLVNSLDNYLKTMEQALCNIKGIEHQLYYDIICKGYTPSQAVNNIAEKTGKDVSTIWKYHYKKIKKELKKLNV